MLLTSNKKVQFWTKKNLLFKEVYKIFKIYIYSPSSLLNDDNDSKNVICCFHFDNLFYKCINIYLIS